MSEPTLYYKLDPVDYMLDKVTDFNTKIIGLETPGSFKTRMLSEERFKFRVGHIHEELDETWKAFFNEDPDEWVDGLIDTIYVALGTLVEMGFVSKKHKQGSVEGAIPLYYLIDSLNAQSLHRWTGVGYDTDESVRAIDNELAWFLSVGSLETFESDANLRPFLPYSGETFPSVYATSNYCAVEGALARGMSPKGNTDLKNRFKGKDVRIGIKEPGDVWLDYQEMYSYMNRAYDNAAKSCARVSTHLKFGKDLEHFQHTHIVETGLAVLGVVHTCLAMLLKTRTPVILAFDEVQKANMAKVRGESKRGPSSLGFDAIKPDGWTPPNYSAFIGKGK